LHHRVEEEGEQPRLVLWDLESSRRRAGLLVTDYHRPCQFEFSEDGQYVFLYYSNYFSNDYYRRVRWWDTTSGKQCGEIVNCYETTFIDGGRVLVAHPSESGRLTFWDVQTGRQIDEWNLGTALETAGRIYSLSGADGQRFLAIDFDPHYPTASGPRPLQGVLIPAPPPKEPRHAILLDVAARREVGRYLGGSPRMSRDGRWLATVDDDGVVRVWETPP
jgi:WD40 repeat protein